MRQIKSFRSKNELVYDSIRSAIMEGEIKPGARLVIDELAGQLGVSQIPVREALRHLEADGFVTIEPYIGATVTEIDPSGIYEIFGLLEAMEIISGRAACQNMRDEDFEEVEQHLRKMDSLIDDPVAWSHENVSFHQLICDRAKTPLVKHLMQKALDHWSRLRTYYLRDVFIHRIATAHKEHWAMFEAMRSRDPDRLEKIVSEHNQIALAAYMNYLDSLPDDRIHPEK